MKVLVAGHKGWIGGKMCELLDKEGIAWVGSKVRANDKAALEMEIVEVEPTHCMSFIGRTHGTTDDGKAYATIDYLEQQGKVYENVRDNLFSPIVMMMLCRKHKVHFTYLGTGCIFKYDEQHPMGNEFSGFNEETSLPNFFGSSYSVVKGFTDELMHLLGDDVLNLRLRMPISSRVEGRNFVTKITNYEYICSMPNSMSILDDLLPCALKMARGKVTGTVNFTNPGLISHNEILDMYKEIVDPNFTWKNFSLEEQLKILAADRSNNCLNTERLSQLCPEVRHIKDSMRDVLVKMRQWIDEQPAGTVKLKSRL